MSQRFYSSLVAFYHQLKYRLDYLRKARRMGRRIHIDKKIILQIFKKRRFPKLAQFQYLTQFLTRKEKILFIVLTVIFGFSFLGSSFLIYLDRTKLAPDFGGEYVEGIVGYPRFINPLYTSNNDADRDLSALIYSSLMSRNERGALAPDLGSDYKLSEDEKTYTFTLKDEVYWHDGKKFSADDVVFTIAAIKDKNWDSPFRASWERIAVSKIDDLTLAFRLEKPSSALLSLLTVGILPKHIWEKVPPANINLAEANSQPVGTGPYKFKSFTKDKVGVIKAYHLVRNNKYYGRKPYIESIIFKFYADYVSAVGALDNHQIDGLAFVPKEPRNVLKLKSRLISYEIILPQFNAIFFNVKINQNLRDKAVRGALNLAINRKKIFKEALDDEGVLINGPVPPGYLGYTDKLTKISYEPEAAKKLLEEAGWVLKGENQYRANKKGEKLKVVLITIEKSQNSRAAAMIKKDWENIGVETELKIISAGGIFLEVIDNRKYEALLFGEMYGPDLDFYSYWHSSAASFPGLNLAMYSNRQADALLEQARETTDRIIKQKKYEDWQLLLAEDSPAIFLWQPKYTYLIDKKIKGLQMGALLNPADRFSRFLNGYINMKRVFR